MTELPAYNNKVSFFGNGPISKGIGITTPDFIKAGRKSTKLGSPNDLINNPASCKYWNCSGFLYAMIFCFGQYCVHQGEIRNLAGYWYACTYEGYDCYLAYEHLDHIMHLWKLYEYDNFWLIIKRFPSYLSKINTIHNEMHADKAIERNLSTKCRERLCQEGKIAQEHLQSSSSPRGNSHPAAQVDPLVLFYKNMQSAFHENENNLFNLLEQNEKDRAVASNSIRRDGSRIKTIKDIIADGAIYTHQKHNIPAELAAYMRQPNAEKRYAEIFGNQLQQFIHAECITLLTNTISLKKTSVLYDHKPALLDCIEAAREYNQAGFCNKAVILTDFCWAALDYSKALIEGCAWGVTGAVQDMIEHPLLCASCVIIPEGVFVYQLGKLLLEVADIGTTCLLDEKEGKRKLNRYTEPIGKIIDAIQHRQIKGPDIVRGMAQLACYAGAQRRLLSGLNKFYSTSKSKLDRLISENAKLCTESYKATPEGMLLDSLCVIKPQNNGHGKIDTLFLENDDYSRVVFEFSGSAAKHMREPARAVPIQILDAIIKNPVQVLSDPREATEALMYYAHLWKNGKPYNAEVLYDCSTNTIFHFLYKKEALGPLPRIK